MGKISGKKILVMLGEGFEDRAAESALDLLKEAGATVDVAGLEKVPLKGKGGSAIDVTVTVGEADAISYDALVIPGGGGPSNLVKHPASLRLVRDFVESGKPVGAIGTGPLLLVDAGVASGKAITGAHEIKKEIERADAEYIAKDVWTDGNIITAKGAVNSDTLIGAVEAAFE